MGKNKFQWMMPAAAVLLAGMLAACQPGSTSGDLAEGDDAATEAEASSQQQGSAQEESSIFGRVKQAFAPEPPPPPKQATLEAGTPLRVRTTTTLSTKSNKAGETFSATLEEPIVEGDWVIAPKGATVTGKIVNADAGGRVKGRATLAVRLTELHTADGQRIPIQTRSFGVEAKSTVKKDATKIGIGAGVGAAIGAIAGGGDGAAKGAGVGAGAGTGMVLATRGDAAVIASESLINFTLAEPVTITEAQ